MFHGQLPPDRARIELFDAEAEREVRGRGARGMLWQFVALCALCVVALALLFLASMVL
jgi:hypothetical protein